MSIKKRIQLLLRRDWSVELDLLARKITNAQRRRINRRIDRCNHRTARQLEQRGAL